MLSALTFVRYTPISHTQTKIVHEKLCLPSIFDLEVDETASTLDSPVTALFLQHR